LPAVVKKMKMVEVFEKIAIVLLFGGFIVMTAGIFFPVVSLDGVWHPISAIGIIIGYIGAYILQVVEDSYKRDC
jgi:uncharacterized membrane protein